MATQTDARGKVVTTVTDPDKGVVTKVTDPMGQEVNSQYDVLRRLTKASTMLTATQEVKTENIYNGTTGYLTTTKHNTSASSTDDVAYNCKRSIYHTSNRHQFHGIMNPNPS